MSYSRKNAKMGWEKRKKRSGMSRGDQEKIMLNFHESWFLALEFQMDVTQFYEISNGKALFCPEFPRVK